jgi:hypothetical protein
MDVSAKRKKSLLLTMQPAKRSLVSETKFVPRFWTNTEEKLVLHGVPERKALQAGTKPPCKSEHL